MTKPEQSQQHIGESTSEELRVFRAYFREFGADRWDEQIGGDVRAGNLDALPENAVKT